MTLNEIIVSNIESRLPAKIRPSKYIADLLFIEREAAYRRISGFVPFTFSEIVTIAIDLGLSIDNIIEQHPKNNFVKFNMKIDLNKKNSEIYFDMLQDTANTIKELNLVKKLNIMLAINRIPWMCLSSPTLFKFEYYRYLHSCNELQSTTTFGDIEVPEEILEQQKQVAFYCSQLSNITCVIDNDIISRTLKELLYYYERKSLNYDDLQQIKKEFLEFINTVAKTNILGYNDYGVKYELYLSNLCIDTNCAYYNYDGREMEQIWIYYEKPITIQNSKTVAQLHKRYIKNRIKCSTPLTGSNDLLRAQFYEAIKQNINEVLP